MRQFFILISLILIQTIAKAQFTLTGTIRDENGKELPGVIVRVKDTYISTTSSSTGQYKIEKLHNPVFELEFYLLGYNRQKIKVDLNKTSDYPCVLKEQVFITDEVVILGTRAGEKSGMTYSTLTKDEIEQQNFGADLPILLNTQTSVVSTSDAGNGIGYSGIRVRGSDATRTNVTINGIPYNDAESHAVFWVNMPDFASSVKSIQLQRGVGSSTNGAGAFGASVNMQTNDFRGTPYAGYTLSGGSFSTLRNTFEAGTGLIRGFTFDVRASKISSAGYVDRASSNLQSVYASAGWYRKSTSLKLNVFSGTEKTYQAWYGTPQDSLKTNPRYNPAGAYRDVNGNESYYKNETDNYKQTHYQLFFNQEFSRKTLLSIALHYTGGDGYYEQFKQQDKFSKYGLENYVQTFPISGDSSVSKTITKTDLVRQKWLSNQFYGMVFSMIFNPDNRTQLILGGGINQYRGKHFGEIIWAQFAYQIPLGYHYYDNNASKADANMYLKINRDLGKKLNASADLQFRTVNYSFLGYNNALENIQQRAILNFFNPKLGLSYQIDSKQRAYLSWSVGNREPVRDDYTESSPISRPKPEQLHDFELGYRIGQKKTHLSATAYYMQYYNQLVLTGAINDVGAYTRTNVYDSYRAGIELEAIWRLSKNLTLSGNLTLSQNKIRSTFQEGLFDYESNTEKFIQYRNTDISFSPSAISAGTINYTFMNWLDISLIGKYVGKQYLDNTSSAQRKLDAYAVYSVRFSANTKNLIKPNTEIAVQINNLFNTAYISNGYTFSDLYGTQRNDYNYYFPQAGINIMLMVRVMID